MNHLQLTQLPVAKAEMLIRKPVAEVFAAFLNPEITTKFWFTKSSGRLEAGKQVTWSWDMYNASAQVTVKDVEQNQRILIEWSGYGSPNTVEWIFTPYGNDATFVRITNAGFSGDGDELVKQALDSTGGFSWVLAGLKAYLEHNFMLNLIAEQDTSRNARALLTWSTSTTGGIMTTRNDYNRQVIEEFRANGGKVGGVWEGTPLLLLTTTGAKSGERRITPMGYMPDGDCLIVIASNGGAPTHPDWYHNLVAHPEVTVEVGTETFDAIAVVTEDSERDRLWTKEVELYPHLAEYQAKATRQIPVIALSRRES